MRIIAALALAGLAVLPASAEDQRRVIDPVAIYGTWLGLPGAAPTDCAADGYIVSFGTLDKKKFLMTVQHRENGVAPMLGKQTEYMVMPAPAGAPTRIEVFLTSPTGNLGVHIRTGSSIELIPAGPDNSYSTTTLVMQRCG